MSNPTLRGSMDGRRMRHRRKQTQRRVVSRLACESLEDRRLLSTLVWDGDVVVPINGVGSDRWTAIDAMGNTNWFDQSTTNPSIPASGDTLIFPTGALQQTNVNNTAVGNLYELQFTGGAYSITGNQIGLDGTHGITDTDASGSTLLATPLAVTASSTIHVANAAETLHLAGIISGGAGATLTKTGPGSLQYDQAAGNTFAGTTQVNDGNLALNAPAFTNVVAGPLVIGDDAGAADSAVVNLLNTDQIGDTAPVTINSDGLLFAFGESVGDLTINGGTADTGVNTGLGATGTTTLNGGQIVGAATFFIQGNQVDVTAGATISSPVDLFGDSTFDVADDGAVEDDLVVSGSVTGGGIVKTGVGRMLLSGNNSYAGATDINEGILAISHDNALGSPVAGTTVADGATLELRNNILSSEGITLNGTGVGGVGALWNSADFNALDGTVVLATDTTIGVAPGTDLIIAVGGLVTGAGELTKIGGGPFTIAVGADSDVTTLLAEGVFQVNGTTGPVILAGGRLQGIGFTGPVTGLDSGGTIAPGTSPGIITTGTLTLDDATDVEIEINGPVPGLDYDRIQVNGQVFLNNANLVVLLGGPPGISAADPPYIIISNDGVDLVNGVFDFNGVPLLEGDIFDIAGNTFRITYLGGDGNDVVLDVIAPPVAFDDIYGIAEGSILFVPAPGILGNDFDPDLDPLVAVLVAGPINGTLALDGDGSFTYIPAPGFSGVDTFTYQAFDGIFFSNIATVTIFVNAVNEAPVTNPDFYTTNEDTDLVVVPPGVLINDYSPDGLPLTAELLAAPAHGILLTGLNADGSFTYVPDPDFNGTDTFTYRARDSNGLGSIETLVTIFVRPIGDQPIAVDDAFSVSEGTDLFVASPGVLANDSDPDNPGSITGLVSFLVAGPSHGTVFLNADGSFTYTPDPLFNGDDTFVYGLSNGSGLTDTATVTITVNPVTNAPIARDDVFATPEGTPLVAAAPGVLANDTDPDDPGSVAALGAQLAALPLFGVVTLNADGSFTYTTNDPFFNGADSFTYRAFKEDPLNPGTFLFSDLATVTIVVTDVNFAPTAVDDAFSINEDTDLIVSAPGVLGNDSDPDGDPLSAFLIDGPFFGTVALNSDGSLVYTPNQFFNGVDSFRYQASDGELLSNVATVTITVNPVATRPVANDDSYGVNEDGVLVVADPGILINDVYPDGLPNIVVVNGPLSGILTVNPGGGFTYTPDFNFNGVDSFVYYLEDPVSGLTSNTATVFLNVISVNDPPTANPDLYVTNEDTPLTIAAPGVLGNDTDPDGDGLTAFLTVLPSNGIVTLNPDGSFVYTPNTNFFGTDTFVYVAFDGSLTSLPATVTIQVNQVEDRPIAVDDSYSVLEDGTLTVAGPGILLNDSYPDSFPTPPSIFVINGPLHGTLTVAPSGGITYVPSANFFGTDSFTYYIQNPAPGILTSNSATVTINVVSVPDAPVGVADAFTTNEDVPLTVGAPGVLYNDVNVDRDQLRAVLIAGPSSGSVALNSDGSFTYTPDANFNGTDTFSYVPVNTSLPGNVTTVTITVRPVADAPIALDDSFTVLEDAILVVPNPGILANDSDPDGQILTAVLVNPPLHGTLTLNAAGGFTYTPAPEFSGVDSFTYRAFDGTLFSNLATVTLNVTPIGRTTLRLDPLSDTGVSDTDRITKDNTPTWFGVANGPNLLVRLYARLAGSSAAPTEVGNARADAAGNYAITSSLLADGLYEFFAQAFREDGRGTGIVNGGPLLVDTVAPVVTNSLLSPKTGQVYTTFQDNASGMSAPSLADVANYSFAKIYTTAPRAFAVTRANVQPAAQGPAGPQTVILDVFNGGRPLSHGRYLFAAISGGIADVAGNALDGEFSGSFPTGNGQPGTNFYAQFNNNGKNLAPALPTTEFVPIITPPTRGRAPSLPAAIAASPTRLPGGPLARLRAKLKAQKPTA